jgi:hypothetical protein
MKARYVAVALLGAGLVQTADANVISNMNTGAVYPTIQLAHDAAHEGDTLFVYPGEHLEWGITITNGITLMGGDPATTILQAWLTPSGAVDRVMQIHAGDRTVRVANMTIRYGCRTNENDVGGGIWVGSGATTFSNCVITANRASDGGGVAGVAWSVNPTLLNCTISSNRAIGSAGGGAMWAGAFDCLVESNFAEALGGGFWAGALTRCTVRNNSAGGGGGVAESALASCVVEGNTAITGGGSKGGDLYDCLVRNNTAYEGGGMAEAAAYGCTFIGNHADDGGGGIWCEFYSCLMISNSAASRGGGAVGGDLFNCTVLYNSAGEGGGIYEALAEGCIIAYNTAPNGPNVCYYGAPEVTRSTILPGGYPGAGNLALDPRFVNPAAGDYRLRVDSPCIDVGGSLTGTDLDGRLRFQGSAADMGAYEYPVVCVSKGGAHTPPYETWSRAATNLQVGVNAASNDVLVLVSNGVHVTASEWVITNRIVVRSLYGAEVTAVDGQNARRCLSVLTNAVIEGLSFTNGRADVGGGIYLSDGATLRSCVVTRCFASNYGGGIFFGAGGGTAEFCVVRGNVASNNQGGGIYARAGDVIRNCLIVTNWAREGGGVLTYQGGLVESCTLADNISLNYAGGGVRLYQGGDVRNSIVYNNTAPGGTNIGVVVPAGTVTYSCTWPAFPGVGNLTNPPGFRVAGDFRLAYASPCRNTGLPASWMTNALDLDGHARIVETNVDLGAYEFLVAYVSPTGSHTAPFDTWARAGTNIQAVLDRTAAGALVRVAEGTYRADTNLPSAATACVVVTNILDLEADGARDNTVLDGQGVRRGLTLLTNAIVRGFTISNGFISGAGGGVYLAGGGSLSSCAVLCSTAGTYGGGAFLSYRGNIRECEFRLNRALVNDGGGIYLSNGGEVERCLVISNSSRHGGGLYADGHGLVRNTLVAGNLSTFDGGGVHLYGTNNLLEHVTITANAGRHGGGIYILNNLNTLRNSIVYGNSASDDGPEWSGATATWQYNCTFPIIGTHCITSPPGFANPDAGDYHLGPGSSLDDGGMELAHITNDLDGILRPLDGDRNPPPGWDLGAYEYLHPFGDTDLDGMPDGWEQEHYGHATAGDPTLDEDEDGSPNLNEAVANMNPHDETSVFALQQLSATGGTAKAQVPSWSSRVYHLENATNLTPPFLWQKASPIQVGNNGLLWLTATNHPPQALLRARVMILP